MEDNMPTEAILVLALVGVMFVVFAAGLTYADLSTRKFRD